MLQAHAIATDTRYKLCVHFFDTADGICVNSHGSEMLQCSGGNAPWNTCHRCRPSRLWHFLRLVQRLCSSADVHNAPQMYTSNNAPQMCTSNNPPQL